MITWDRIKSWKADLAYWFHAKVVNHDLLWWIRYRMNPSHAYHQVDLNLNPSYYEVDVRMTIAVFELAIEFVQQQLVHNAEMWFGGSSADKTLFERGIDAIIIHQQLGQPDHISDIEHNAMVQYYSTLLEIYVWFGENKSLIISGGYSPIDGKDWEERRDAFNLTVEAYLIQLIQMRSGMWT